LLENADIYVCAPAAQRRLLIVLDKARAIWPLKLICPLQVLEADDKARGV
jgi:hypothetical protein